MSFSGVDHPRSRNSRSVNWWLRDLIALLIGFSVTVLTHIATTQAQDVSPSPSSKSGSKQPEDNKKVAPGVKKGSDQLQKSTEPNKQDGKPIRGGDAANASLTPNAIAPPNLPSAPRRFGQLDAGQGTLLARNQVPVWFGDFFDPGRNLLNVPGTPLHNSPLTPGATPLALGFASVATPGTLTPSQLYFRSVNTTGPAAAPFVPAPGSNTYVYRTNQPGINFTTPPTYQLDTIPPLSTNPASIVGFFVPLTSTQVTVSPAFHGELNQLQQAAPTLINGHPLNDVVAVGAPITNFGTTQSAVDTVYALFADTQPPNFHAQPLVYQANGATQIPILFVQTTNTSTSVYSPSVAAGGVQKLVDNASPLPRDRVFFNYSYFDHSAIVVDGRKIDINRLTPGFEKSFLNQRMSLEFRFPFATTIDNVNLTGTTNTGDIIFGNQTTYLKALVYSNPNLSLSTGLGIQFPTAPSTKYTVNGYALTATGEYTEKGPIDILRIDNQAVHLLPYLGAVYTPNDHFYLQAVSQLNFSTNGNTVSNAAVFPVLNSSADDPKNWTVTSATTGLGRAGSLNDTNYLYLSGNAGYWIYKTTNPYERGLTGFAPTLELHYNQSLQRADSISGFYGNPGSGIGNISQVNGVVGANAVFGNDKYLSVACVTPFGTGVNRAFDAELRVMFNYYFGTPRVNPRFRNVPGQ